MAKATKPKVDEVEETLAIMDAIAVEKDPNVVRNKWPRYMSAEQAQDIIDKYEGQALLEVPNELVQAREVLGK